MGMEGIYCFVNLCLLVHRCLLSVCHIDVAKIETSVTRPE
jgi:hypothetical protein